MKKTAKRLQTGATHSSAVTELEQKNSDLAFEMATESIILLENDGALPLAPGSRVALYGNGVLYTLKGGTGSGEVNGRHDVSVYEGMKNAGFIVASERWLRDYEREFEAGKAAFAESVKQKLIRAATHLELNAFGEAFGMSYEYPYGRAVTEQDVRESNTDVCFYVISRQCGENMDRNPDDFSYHLTEKEARDLRFCAEHYAKTVLVLNVGAAMDLSELEADTKVNAIVCLGMQGCRGGDAFAAVVSGTVSPSGRLTETWARRYDDVPNGRSFGKMAPRVLEQDYKEGIYVGYRYYRSFHVPVRYPFGYGLSYTQFRQECVAAAVEGGQLKLRVRVTNVGEQYAGKDVVQLYVSVPQARLDHPALQLAAFAKTEELQPGDSQELRLTVDFRELGSFDEALKETFLETGSYGIFLGKDSEHVTPVGAVTLEREVVLSRHRSLKTRPLSFTDLKRDRDAAGEPAGAGFRLTLDPGAFGTETFGYAHPYPALSAEDRGVLDGLSVEDCIDLVVGDGLDVLGRPHDFICPGAVGYSTSKLVRKGVPLMIFSDGPNGLRLQKRNALKKDRIRAVDPMGEIFSYLPAWIFRLIHADEKKSELLYQFTTAFPVGNMAAQTWNTALLEREGEAVSAEMARYGINFWLGPGVNIHRNPLNGRNYEYYSEDPVLTGRLAAAVTRGVQKRRGTYVTLKHFCCNNQEEQRGYMSANVSERALREIYLKGFALAVKESRPMGIMTSYNKTNGIYNSNNPALLLNTLRCEWGYDGLVMTDWLGTTMGAANAAKAIASGNELLMPGTGSDKKAIRRALKKGVLSEEALRLAAGNILRIARQSERPLS